jgi:hypothetical protein
MNRVTTASILVIASVAGVFSQPSSQGQGRSPSPDGIASVQLGWRAEESPALRIANGKWVDVIYGRPLRRGRADLFGTGGNYGTALKGDKVVWRAGANVLTRLRSEIPLLFGGKTVPAGEHCLFIDLKNAADWTLIVSSQTTAAPTEVAERSSLWNAFVYQPDKDVARVPMKVETLPYVVEQLTYSFTDVTGNGATLRLTWDTVSASVGFAVAR